MGVRVDGGRYRVSPFPFIGEHTEALTVVVAFGGTYVLGWIAPYIWLTTRYRIGRTSLELCAGPIYQKLELRKIEMVLRTRQGVDLGFAFDSDFLWIGYPSSWGGLPGVSSGKGDIPRTSRSAMRSPRNAGWRTVSHRRIRNPVVLTQC